MRRHHDLPAHLARHTQQDPLELAHQVGVDVELWFLEQQDIRQRTNRVSFAVGRTRRARFLLRQADRFEQREDESSLNSMPLPVDRRLDISVEEIQPHCRGESFVEVWPLDVEANGRGQEFGQSARDAADQVSNLLRRTVPIEPDLQSLESTLHVLKLVGLAHGRQENRCQQLSKGCLRAGFRFLRSVTDRWNEDRPRKSLARPLRNADAI
ncbi:MAG: hypothetical protein AAGC60_24195 [Acidobacteriota bacterium]